MFYVPFWRPGYWGEVLFEIRWYLFLAREPKKYVGHNPLAQLAMFFFITLGVLWMITTGFALYAEGAQAGSLPDIFFGWMRGIIWNSQTVHTLHHLGMWWIIIFMIIHIYVAIREDIMSRQSIVSTMISGHRTFKDDRPD
jgi:Ni/Fe-hydrogenase 1 B-type cytochrome subunit